MNNVETKKVEAWWNSNPFSYGTAGTNTDQVGAVSDEAMTLEYFDKITGKLKKYGGVTDPYNDTRPLLYDYIDYSSLAGKKVLDIATGPGLFLVEFAKAGANATGIDLTSYAVKHAKTNLKLRNLHAEVIQMDAQNLEFQDNTFDYVNAWGCVMHMPDTEGAIKEIHRVLKPGGKGLIFIYNRNSWTFWFNFMFLRGLLLGQLFRYKFDIDRLTSRYADGATVGGCPLAKFYSKRQLKKMIDDADFSNATYSVWSRAIEPESWPLRSFPICKFLPRSARQWLSSKMGLVILSIVEK